MATRQPRGTCIFFTKVFITEAICWFNISIVLQTMPTKNSYFLSMPSHYSSTILFFASITTCLYANEFDFGKDDFDINDVFPAGSQGQDFSSGFEHFNEFGAHNFDFDHELVTGSQDEVHYFKQLEPEEAKTRLSMLVERMDENHDGQVDREELKHWIIKSFKCVPLH